MKEYQVTYKVLDGNNSYFITTVFGNTPSEAKVNARNIVNTFNMPYRVKFDKCIEIPSD